MKKKFSLWQYISSLFTILLILPILAIIYTAVSQSDHVFSHLFATVLPTYIYNTFALVAGTMALSLILGVTSAWIIVMCRIPGAKFLQWLLVLPLAMPGYIVGYIYTNWFDFACLIQRTLRALTGWTPQDYWFPDIRSLGGAILILSLVLYPYVYLLCRSTFMEQSSSLLQSARLLKCSPFESFIRISLPLARPAMAISLSLVAMEAIGDYGTMSYFSVNTLTTAVYDTWLGYSSLSAAAKISLIMLLIIFLLIGSERFSRRKQSLYQGQNTHKVEQAYALKGWKKWLATCYCWGLVILAFIAPFIQLVSYSFHYFLESWNGEFQQYAINSFYISCIAALCCLIVALTVNFSYRLRSSKYTQMLMRLSSLGYAIPGTVLAIGVLFPVLKLDHFINDIAKFLHLSTPGLIFSSSIFAIVFAMVVRFAAIAIGSIESHLQKISPSLDMAARTLGYKNNAMIWHVHLPLLKKGILISSLLIFIESMKELNATLLLRPFNFETLATFVYNYASDEQLELAAFPAVLLILVGLIPLIIVNRSLEKNHS